MFALQVEGLQEVLRSARDADRELERGIHQAVGDACSDGAAEARSRAPIRTGKLASSIRGRLVTGGTKLAVGFVEAEADHAIFVEEPTAPHTITPKREGGLLRFQSGGKTVFAHSVNHPGTKAQPFMAPSVPVVESSLETHTQAAAARAVAKF